MAGGYRAPTGDGLEVLAARISALADRIRELEQPTGTQLATVVNQNNATENYLGGLKTEAAGGSPAVVTGTVANDGVPHYFASSPDTQIPALDVPTGKLLVTASVGEASLTPGGSFVVGYVTYSVRDANGVNIPGASLGSNQGRLYTDQRMGLSISTGPQLVTIPDPVVYPGPYVIRAFVGMWVATLNTTPCSGVFNDLSLVAQVIGDGV